MGWIIDFFSNVFGNFWSHLGSLALKLLMGPLAFFLFGPMFKVSGFLAEYVLGKIKAELGDVGLIADGVTGWLVDCLRLQECVSALMTFLILGLMVSLMKKVF